MSSRLATTIVAALLGVGLLVGVARGDEDEDNPHEKMVRSKSVCIDCHTKVPKPGEHAADYLLVDPPSEGCLGCHTDTEHSGVHEHLGKDVGAAALPADEHGKIACFTCHDPHPAGVIEGRSVYKSAVNGATRAFIASRELAAKVERREPSEAFGGLLRSPPVDDGCPVCHASAKDGSWKERALWSEHIRFLPRY